ncbi:MAG: diacylglycerol kinase family protein [Patescibacteria group bacterium]
MFSLTLLTKSFFHALRGLSSVYRHEQNFRLQVWAALVVIVFGGYVGITLKEWVIIILVITLVLLLELLNTVIERMIDVIKPKIHEYVRVIKDVMAAAVLISSLAAVVVGIIVFYPYVQDLLR